MALSATDAFSAGGRRPGRRSSRRRRAALAEINVTPLVDVMLVLLIIFMISAPLLTGAAALHLVVFVLFAVVLKQSQLLPIGSSVPINIVSNDPLTNTRAAEQAPEPQTAATETPVPETPPQVPSPPQDSAKAP